MTLWKLTNNDIEKIENFSACFLVARRNVNLKLKVYNILTQIIEPQLMVIIELKENS